MKKKLEYIRYILIPRILWNMGGGLIDAFISYWHLNIAKKPPLWGDSQPCELRLCRFCGNGTKV